MFEFISFFKQDFIIDDGGQEFFIISLNVPKISDKNFRNIATTTNSIQLLLDFVAMEFYVGIQLCDVLACLYSIVSLDDLDNLLD